MSIKRTIHNSTCLVEDYDDYTRFHSINDRGSWWDWAFSELMAITYNSDSQYTLNKLIFCDTNAIIIGVPRIRKYSVDPTICKKSLFEKDANNTLNSFLGITKCFPEYLDHVDHVKSYHSDDNKRYEWDAHYLSIMRGRHAHYSYTNNEHLLPDDHFGALLYLLMLQAETWITLADSTRASITEFTLYHPSSQLFSTIHYIVEFPAVSGADPTITVETTKLERYNTVWTDFTMFAEMLLLPFALHLLIRNVLLLYKCRMKFWQSIGLCVDILFMALIWCYMICLMIRAYIAEDLLWLLKVSYYQQFVNIKSLMSWDNALDSILALLIWIHVLRSLCLFNYFPRFYSYGLTLRKALSEVVKITIYFLCITMSFITCGYLLFHSTVSSFMSFYDSSISVFAAAAQFSKFLIITDDLPSGLGLLANIYYSIIALGLCAFATALYIAAFIHAKKTTPYKRRNVEITIRDIIGFIGGKWKDINPFKAQEKDTRIEESTFFTPDICMAEIESQFQKIEKKLGCCYPVLDMKYSNINVEYAGYYSPSQANEDTCSNASASVLRTISGVLKNSCDSEVDTFAEVPSLRTDIDNAQKLVEGMQVYRKSSSVTAKEIPRQLVYDKKEYHINKFLDDVHATANFSASGTKFSKYGKHNKKLRINSTLLGSSISSLPVLKREDSLTEKHNTGKNPHKINIDLRLRNASKMSHSEFVAAFYGADSMDSSEYSKDTSDETR